MGVQGEEGGGAGGRVMGAGCWQDHPGKNPPLILERLIRERWQRLKSGQSVAAAGCSLGSLLCSRSV